MITLAFIRLDFLIGPLTGPLSLYSNITSLGMHTFKVYKTGLLLRSLGTNILYTLYLFGNTSLHDLLLHLYEQQCWICYLCSGDRALEAIRRQKVGERNR